MKYLLIDGNSIGRAAHSSSKLTIGDFEVQAIFGVLKTIRRLTVENPDATLIVLWDGKAKWRYSLFPLYKSNRNNTPDKVADKLAYSRQKSEMLRALSLLGVKQMLDKDAEADDLAGYLSRLLGKSGNEVLLVTGDADWKQLITKNVSWMDHRDNNVLTLKTFKKIGFNSPEQLLDAKILGGDTSDTIPGIGGFGDKGIADFFARFSGIDEFLNMCKLGKFVGFESTLSGPMLKFYKNETPKPSKKYGQMPSMMDAYLRNKKLMTLDNYVPKKSSMWAFENKPLDKDGFMDFCQDNLFNSILIQFENWVKPFER